MRRLTRNGGGRERVFDIVEGLAKVTVTQTLWRRISEVPHKAIHAGFVSEGRRLFKPVVRNVFRRAIVIVRLSGVLADEIMVRVEYLQLHSRGSAGGKRRRQVVINDG